MSARAEWCGPICCPHAALANSWRNSLDRHQTSAASMGMAAAVEGTVALLETQKALPPPPSPPLPSLCLLLHCVLYSFCPPDQVGRTKYIRFSNRKTCCPVMQYCTSQVRQGPAELSEPLTLMGACTQFNYHHSKASPSWQYVCRQTDHTIPPPTMHTNWCSQPLLLWSQLGICKQGCVCLSVLSPRTPLLP